MSSVKKKLSIGLAWSVLGCATADPSSKGSQTVRDNPPTAETALALSVAPATGPAAPAQNPFVDGDFFVHASFRDQVLSTIERAPEKAAQMRAIAEQPTALWLDRIAALEALRDFLGAAMDRQRAVGRRVVPVIVVYDLPNRDCAASASAGELLAEENGEARYRSEFIDPIAREIAKFPDLSVVAILEPDSLPNMATNMEVPKCSASADLYKRSVAYAISKLSTPNTYLYVDAAHAGWLGWDGNREAIAEIFAEVLQMAGGPDRIRGFATNVSNYNALDGDWGAELEVSNPCPNEYQYVQKLDETLRTKGITGKGYIIDTGRNGVAQTRSKWGHWCNVRNAGLGERPQVAPRRLVDAFFWVKPPGESDGVSDPSAPRFDESCRSVDSADQAPQAGQWFADYFLSLVDKANPGLR
jgi:cellulose 1,4-beta-cellobiosidase